MEKVIFLDRDGTLNEEVNYLHRKEDLVLLPGVPESMRNRRKRETSPMTCTQTIYWRHIMKLTEKQQEIFEELFVRYPVLEKNREDILKAYEVLETCYRTGGKLLVAGNGGSCADAEHIVGELMKGFRKRRPLDEALQHSLAMENTSHGAACGPLHWMDIRDFPRPLPTMWTRI